MNQRQHRSWATACVIRHGRLLGGRPIRLTDPLSKVAQQQVPPPQQPPPQQHPQTFVIVSSMAGVDVLIVLQ